MNKEAQNIKDELSKTLPPKLVEELFKRHTYLKEKFLGGYFDAHNFESSELNAGKLSEIVLRILQFFAIGTYTPLNHRLNFDESLMHQLEGAPGVSDSIRIHIPRTLRAIHDVRNRRGVGHVHDKLDPNLMDSLFVVSAADWIIAELIRLYANRNPEEAQGVINSLAERNIPVLWELDDKPVILDPKMSKQSAALIFLYSKGKAGASLNEISELLGSRARNTAGFLTQLIKRKLIAKSPKTGRFVITPLGVSFVEKNIPLTVQD